jgi:mannan endo-1,4-beta-mannosidase
MRIWLFVEGQNIPSFDQSGNVVKSDSTGTLLEDLKTYLQFAASKNVFVNLALWNGALMRN